jgi:hypothetical protein
LERLWRCSPKLEIPDEPGVAARTHSFGDPQAAGEAYSK